MSDSISMERPFEFLNMPAELRNRIYELLLTNTRDPSDRIIHVNDLKRRRKGRKDRVSKSEMFRGYRIENRANWYGFLNNTPATKARMAKPISGIPALLETEILRACKQTYRESKHILYTLNSFEVIAGYHPGTPSLDAIRMEFPRGVDISRIHHLRLEVQLCEPKRSSHESVLSQNPFRALRNMHDLASIQIIVTFRNWGGSSMKNECVRDASLFNSCWSVTTIYNDAMRALISSIPKTVEKVTWGLTKEQKEVGDYGGLAFAKGCVLRKIWKTYEGLRGMGWIDTSKIEWRRVRNLPIDGDSEDSGEEMEEEN